MNILIITKDAFPVGLAASARIHCYAKGIIEHGSRAKVLCIKPTERISNIINKEVEGKYEGIPFEYTGRQTVYSSQFFRRRVQNFLGITGLIKIIFRENRSRKVDAIIVYLKAPCLEYLLFLISRLLKISLLKEENEHPSIYFPSKQFLNRIIHNYYLKQNYRIYDGLLLMTRNLIEAFSNDKKNKSRILHVPMTVDYKRFENKYNDGSHESYIAYCGILNNNKDGVDTLINAFSKVSLEFNEIKLFLIGEPENESRMKEYIELVENNQIYDRVVFTGRLNYNAIPDILCKAKLLVLSRPVSLQSNFGFPTKLGEYLATGKPVVVTNTGEIPEYLTDGQSAFLAEPGDADSMAFKIREALSDYNRALEIGKMGKEVVIKHFNYETQTGRILEFIKNFN